MANHKNNSTDKGHGPKVVLQAGYDALPFKDRCYYEQYEVVTTANVRMYAYAKGKNKHKLIDKALPKLVPGLKIKNIIYV